MIAVGNKDQSLGQSSSSVQCLEIVDRAPDLDLPPTTAPETMELFVEFCRAPRCPSGSVAPWSNDSPKSSQAIERDVA